ncbi:RNA-directed DNA polymerase, eukaryota, reverse transcriptase zinc-binding domain protein, partial [Tanacetum coccineum]
MNNEAKRCAMKIDIQKAYDTVNWDFLKNTLQLVGFHEVMIKWIMTCVTTASFSICINGEICRFFKGGRGLRQGDHISSYLFTLMMEVFNMIMIKNIDETHSFKYHYGCKELKLTRMCFADDLMVLCNGDKESLKIVKKSLDDFSNVSGLFPNLNKSIIFFGSLSEERKSELLEVLPFKCGKLHMKYLGVPLLSKKLGANDCKSLIDNVDKRINNWRSKPTGIWSNGKGTIAFWAGPNLAVWARYAFWARGHYWAYVYMLPMFVIHDLEKLFKRFLWNSGRSAQWKARVVWKLVCRPKEQGGLGIKPLRKWNEECCKKDNDSVADMVKNDVWDWPLDWLVTYPILNQVTIPKLSMRKDFVVWIEESKEGEYSVSSAWRCLRDKWPLVEWRYVICFLNVIPNRPLFYGLQSKLILSTTVYFLWNERNKRIFKDESRKSEELIKDIQRNMVDMIMSLKVKNSGAVENAARV